MPFNITTSIKACCPIGHIQQIEKYAANTILVH